MQKNHQHRTLLSISFLIAVLIVFGSESVFAACANIRSWLANDNTTTWTSNNNWNPTNFPNTATESAYIVADWQIPQYPAANYSLSCLEIASGSMTASTGATVRTLTIIDDYFRNVNAGALIIPAGSNFHVTMAGTAAQFFDHAGVIPRLTINNATTVTLSERTTVSTNFAITAGSGNIIIGEDFTTQQTTAITIPSSATVTLNDGVTWNLAGNLTVDGTLNLGPGASLKMANGRTLSVGATGTLQLTGASGNAANIDTVDTSSTFTFNVIGKVNLNYFSISRTTAAGMNVTGQILGLANGSFNYIGNNNYGITLGAAANIPTTANSIGFFGQSALTPRNINATSFNVSGITFNNWQGAGDTANEIDPNNRITWGTESATELLLTNSSPSGAPPATIAASSAYTHFATFAFALSKADTATDISSIKFTINGSNNSSDVAGVRVYRDDNNNCVYNAGVDSLVNTYTPTGSPPQFTANFTSGQLQPSSATPRCVHILLSTSALAQTNNTLGIQIASTDDIVNSQAYNLSATNSPPLSAGTSTITGGTLYKWNGGSGTNMNTAANWTPATVPNNTRDCEIGAGYSIPIMAAAFACRNMNWLSSGTINWNNTANIFSVNGALTIGSGFSYNSTTTAAILRLAGTGAQSVNLNGNTFPGSLQVNNTTGPITFDSSGIINGSLSLNGGITRIGDGVTLTVNGGITIVSGATLDIEPGGVLIMGNGSSLTVNLGGTLEMVGTVSKTADIRAINNTSNYTITVNGNISARYYSVKNLGLNGMTINAGATIDASNFLQNGSYTYPGINNARLLRLFRQIPGNTLDSMTFDAGGSGATGVKSISTNASAGTLSLTNYSGSWTGSANSENVGYLINWVSLTNTLDLTQEAVAPASANQGDVINLGRFGFKQTTAGAFANTDITYLRLDLAGTGSSSDIDSISLYYDAACAGTGGTLVGTTAFSGSPARAEFSSITGATVQSHATTPPKRCFYVMASLSSSATNGATVGVTIDSSTYVSNSQSYLFNGAASPPISVGTTSIVGSTTYWTGATSTAWATAGNWNGGVPTAALNCVINSAVRNPIITTSAVCKSVTIGTGALTINAPGQLEVYGGFSNTGTFTQNSRPLIFRDNGVTPTSQTVFSSSALTNLSFNKTAGGSVSIDSSNLTVNSAISMGAGSNFSFLIPANKTLTIGGSFNLTSGTLSIAGGGTLEIPSGQTLTLNGGTLATTGVNDSYPQSLTNKAKITRSGGAGTWGFTATSGTLNLVGFLFEWLDTSGLNIGGTTNVTQINGGQLRSLPNTASMRAVQINTTGSLPSTISNFGWYWGSGNSVPSQATVYYLGYSSGCGSRTITFDQWHGDFWPYTDPITTNDKISETACNIVIDKANSPVSLTEFKATSYDGKVVLEWTTGLEWYHKGFNIYRSISPEDGYTQINTHLIRNDLFSTSIHGSYAFIDEDATNGITYYYKLEDISTTDDRTLHGPLIAQPLSALGAPHVPLAHVIVSSNPSGSQSAGGTGSQEATPGVVNLEPHVDLISKTHGALRLKITIPALHIYADPLHNNYHRLEIPLYSKTITAGHPELLSRTLMIKIDSTHTSASATVVSETASTQNLLVAPAPEWVVVNQQYQSQWTLDSSAYASGTANPLSAIQLDAVVKNNGQSYLPITISPVQYTASSSTLKKYDELTVDIFLNGNTSWQPTTPITISTAWGTPGALKIGLNQEGVYNISYNDMISAGVVAPFHLADTTKLKLILQSQEHPLEITSANGFWNSGDSLRFYARPNSTLDSDTSFALLIYDYGSPLPGLRMTSVDVSIPSGLVNSQPGHRQRLHLEENNVAIFNEPYDEDMDLFVWGLFYKEVGGAGTALETEVELPGVISSQNVTLQVLAKTRTTTAANYQSQLEVLVNDLPVPQGKVSFPGGEPQMLTFTLPAVHFAPGKNKLTLRPTGEHLIPGEYDMVYIDHIDVYYQQEWSTQKDQLLILNTQPGSDLYIDGFSQSPEYIYDISRFGDVDRLTNAQIQHSGNFSVGLNTPNDTQKGRRIWLTTESQLASPTSMELIYGSEWSATHHEADVIYIGTKELLDAVQPLSVFRESQGFKTKLVELSSIYNEFGQGVVSSQAVRDFLIYANENWQRAPQYVVLLGDGTYDPKGYQNPVPDNQFPVKLLKGSAFNYGSDHWFVTQPDSMNPFAVIGRIPARTHAELSAYVQKVLAYETGKVKPQSPHLTLLSDKPHYQGENFDAFTSHLKANIDTWTSPTMSTMISRTKMGDVSFKQKVEESFQNSSMIHFMGHGAENIWADPFIFNTNDVDSLQNTQLPVVVAMNCLNAHFYDPSLISLSEKLVLKPQGGAIVFWGSTSLTPPTVQATYQNAFYEQLLKTPSSIGHAVQLSKQQAHLQTPFPEALHSWTIIGDPMVSAVLPAKNTPQATAPAATSSNSSRGCSAFAQGQNTAGRLPLDLLLSFFLEVLFSLVILRRIFRSLRQN